MHLNIETLILVAIWKRPAIFQGCFTVTNKNDNSSLSLFFRCECSLENATDLIDDHFSPYHYQFTHLYTHQHEIELIHNHTELEQALYILKYALKLALEKMLMRPQHHSIYIDEIAMSSMSQAIESYINNRDPKNIDNNIGFAVAMDFNPTESSAQASALTLLNIRKYAKSHPVSACLH